MDIQNYIDSYIDWLKNEITFNKIGEYYEITAPFLDNDSDYLQFYVRFDGNEVFFTDDGYTINSLESTGLKITPIRRKQLTNIIKQYGVSLDKMELTLRAHASDFAQKKHLFIQCMLRVSDLYLTSRTKIATFFLDDILNFFQQNEIYCMENVQFTGKSGFTHNYDFAIQRSRTKPERLCFAINNPTTTSMKNALFTWDDTRPSRRPDSELIILLNDSNRIAKGIEEGFANYNVSTIRWSEREASKNIDLLSA